MKFIDYSSSPTSVLTDGQFECAYRDIPGIFQEIRAMLVNNGVGIQDCLTVECDNSVANALILLYLLEEGHRFLVLPKESSLEGKPFLPGFSRYKIETKAPDKGETGRPVPKRFLSITENEKWIGERDTAGQKLYLRTSGSTGSPKMAVHSHAKLRDSVRNCVKRLRLDSSHRVAIPVPLSHSYGLTTAFLPSVMAGASVDLQRGANILRYLQREKEFDTNTVFMTPVFCETLLKGRKSPRPYKLTVIAGDRVRGNMFERYESLFGCMVQLYGSTEMGAIATAGPDTPTEFRATTVGKPLENVQMRLEQEQSEQAQEGTGELLCRHRYGFDGYVDENGEPLDLAQGYQDGWFRTRDFGRIRPEGYLEVYGRYDHSVNRDGLLVLFSDVEKAIETMEGVDAAAVVTKGESGRGKGLVAYCVLGKGIDLTEKDIRSACFDLLPRNAIPDRIVIVRALPLLGNGKIDRQKLMKDGE
uniref:AMP-binding enzyme C-terminal domain-containing protein n=1 Tax=Candidatus Kentrum sp. FM TaxID=2126340 RepID=A0A450VN03_9GAMM|nr:MAG: AMP-binding enzyme C-terminal domain-containing protein [Candidatus Kentron sp. FM]VFJ72736.1 MAG: AMP-binding enzyme C-terminal domain-containing protein [Candidatus Kentron sp. FM]VFK06087.1 MAG: AMP-binding enzyme C-terminal domain-containing protein [Candidatus Kentron sp. FM]